MFATSIAKKTSWCYRYVTDPLTANILDFYCKKYSYTNIGIQGHETNRCKIHSCRKLWHTVPRILSAHGNGKWHESVYTTVSTRNSHLLVGSQVGGKRRPAEVRLEQDVWLRIRVRKQPIIRKLWSTNQAQRRSTIKKRSITVHRVGIKWWFSHHQAGVTIHVPEARVSRRND